MNWLTMLVPAAIVAAYFTGWVVGFKKCAEIDDRHGGR